VQQASLTCSIAPDATIKNMAALGGIEGKEVRHLTLVWHTRHAVVCYAISLRGQTADEASMSQTDTECLAGLQSEPM